MMDKRQKVDFLIILSTSHRRHSYSVSISLSTWAQNLQRKETIGSTPPAGLQDVGGLHELLIGPRFVSISLRIHGGVSGHVDSVLSLDSLSDKVVNGDGASSIGVKRELDVVSGRGKGEKEGGEEG